MKSSSSSPRLTPIRKNDIRLPAMIDIPAGEFTMGTSDHQVMFLFRTEDWAIEWYENDLFMTEQPQDLVSLPAYQIAKYPVTNLDYFYFVWNSGYRAPKRWFGLHYPDEEGDHPVTGISRSDALAYIAWLNKQTKKEFRLPTEAEWEKAARGSEDSRIFPWGDEFDPWRCNTLESNKGGTTPIGAYSPGGDSPYGVADMAGNVWEWTTTSLQPYPYDSTDGREEDKPGDKCVVRGGSWYYSRKLARCSAREGVLASYISPAIGFRLAHSL